MKRYSINKTDNSKLFCFSENIPFAGKDYEIIKGEEYSLDEAENLLLELLEDEPDNLEALSNLFIIEVLKNHLDQAYDLLNHILGIDPKNNFAVENLKLLTKLSA